MLDRIDKDILKVLMKNKWRHLTTNQIAKKAEIAPLTAMRHLTRLEEEGYVIKSTSKILRKYKYMYNPMKEVEEIGKMITKLEEREVIAPSKISWNLRYKKED